MRKFHFNLLILLLACLISSPDANAKISKRNLQNCQKALLAGIESQGDNLAWVRQLERDFALDPSIGRGFSVFNLTTWFPEAYLTSLFQEAMRSQKEPFFSVDLLKGRHRIVNIYRPFVTWLDGFIERANIYNRSHYNSGRSTLMSAEIRVMRNNREFWAAYSTNAERVHADPGLFTAIIPMHGDGPFVTSNLAYIEQPIIEVKGYADMVEVKTGNLVVLSNEYRRSFTNRPKDFDISKSNLKTPHSSPGTDGPRMVMILQWW